MGVSSEKSLTKEKEKLKYPKSVFFIVSNEFCERFSYYGMRTILSIYLTDMLLYSEADAKIIYHTFTMLVYFFPVFGAMLADSYLGKFRTIFYVSIIYACGNVILALAATEPIHLPKTEFSMLGLVLIALGTGGIKPCVSAFGGDQFTLPQQAKQLAAFFSMFYFAINSGSFVSTFLTPILREMECFGSSQCFTWAFGVPGILMVISIIIFGLGKKLYKIREPEGNMVIKVSKCIGNAITTKSKSSEKKDHWLDYAEPKYGRTLVEDVKSTLRVLVLYIPLPVFWALFDQQGTGWTFMARRMDGDIGFYTILPDQMQVVNPILILIFIPLFDIVIYPILNWMRVLKTPLQRLVAGGVLAAVAFAISAGISIAIEAENPILPEAGQGQITFYNMESNLKLVYPNGSKISVDSMGYTLLEDFDVSESKLVKFKFEYDTGNGPSSAEFEFKEEKTLGYYLQGSKFKVFEDSLEKNGQGLPSIRMIISNDKEPEIEYILDETVEAVKNLSEPLVVKKPGEYRIKVDGKEVDEKFTFKLGGVYTVLLKESGNNWKVNSLEITPHNGVHMLWIIPQYIVITMAEIMFSITGLEFSYSQAPTSMKSVLQACWLLTTAFGNLIVVIIESVEPFEEQSNNFFLYAGLMLVDMAVFSLMAMRYKYVDNSGVPSEDEDAEGIENAAYNNGVEKS